MKILIKRLLRENLLSEKMVLKDYLTSALTTEDDSSKLAVIEILIPIAYLKPKDYFQIVPYESTKERLISIKKGSAGPKMISTKNIKVLKVFDESQHDEMLAFLQKLTQSVV